MKKWSTMPETQFLKIFFSFFSLSFLIAAFFMPDRGEMLTGLWRIFSSPAKAPTNYFSVGGYAATFLNMALVGLIALGLFVILMLIMVITSFFSLFFQKLFYKFTPLPEGELRDRLMGLFAAHGYTAKEIYVMNASKRTTRANAFCTGLGKGKKIALFDNLVEGYTEDEITAVFAHELGHAKHRDTLKLVGLQAIIYAAMSLLITFMLTSETVSLALGFDTYNAAGAFIALSAVVLGPVMTILMAPINILSRRFERAADTFAVDNGLGDPLVDALTRLHRDSLADLNPHPFLSAIGDSHPTLGERIQVVRSAQEKRGERPPAA